MEVVWWYGLFPSTRAGSFRGDLFGTLCVHIFGYFGGVSSGDSLWGVCGGLLMGAGIQGFKVG